MNLEVITPNLLEELIRILEQPTYLKSENRFRILEQAYLLRNKRNEAKPKSKESWG